MAAKITVVGVHPIAAVEPCHLVEILVEGAGEQLDFGGITQELKGQPRSNWQVAYDEQILEERLGHFRCAFFFHYLNLATPLHTPLGLVSLPKETPTPGHLSHMKYDAP
jgi:hypothetical protein